MANTITKIKKKSIFKSKTIGVNMIMALMAAFNQLGDLGVSPEKVIIAVGILNILLRLITTEPLKILPNQTY